MQQNNTRVERKNKFIILGKFHIMLEKITGFVELTKVRTEDKKEMFSFSVFFDGNKTDFIFDREEPGLKFQDEFVRTFYNWQDK
jgi:hypothetical protein